ncbi:glucosaminidase domain-containing protein [Lactobacillus sp. Marseille-P7033]|nr:glucosaminidase domain-containing protein [Lactobacillus sp. Marseille-P7033]NGC77336.1 hypothetical protein [Limosilactobacillus reuteri]
MNITKHYKMYKKGKNWCYMAIATLAVAVGVLSVSQGVSADATNSIANTTSVSVAPQETQSQTTGVTTKVMSSTQDTNEMTNDQGASAAQDDQQALVESKSAVAPQAATPQNGWQTDNESSYYYKDGQKVIGQQSIDGKNYYFNDQGQQQKNYFLNQANRTYYFQADGTRLDDGFYNNWGHTYYFQKDGSRLDNGFYNNWGHTYYFQKDGSRLDNGFYNNWGHTYYFGQGGVRLDDGFYNNWGHTYYFGQGGVRLDDGFYNNWGHTYYFQKDGSRLDNGFYNNWGHTYYFGNDGARWDNRFMNAWGNVYYFGKDGALLQGRSTNLGYGNLDFDSQGRLTSSNAFIGSIVNGAIQGWAQHQILPSLTLAQAILESAWGKSSLASQYHNLFGIKGSYKGMSVNMPTYEEYGGRMVLINDAFRRYPDNNASVQDHTDFLIKNSRYHNLIGVRDANTATYLIRADGYATASSYTNSLRSVINTYDLTRYDRVAFNLE